jgi:hypothetical protein
VWVIQAGSQQSGSTKSGMKNIGGRLAIQLGKYLVYISGCDGKHLSRPGLDAVIQESRIGVSLTRDTSKLKDPANSVKSCQKPVRAG